MWVSTDPGKGHRNTYSSIHNGGSGPLFDGSTEPASPSPQQCLVLQPTSLSVASGPLFDGDRPTEPPISVWFYNHFPSLWLLDNFSMRADQVAARNNHVCLGQPTENQHPAFTASKTAHLDQYYGACSTPLAGPIHRTIEPDLMQSVHPCDILRLEV